MVFQVIINFNKNRPMVLTVAQTEDDFKNTTVKQLKEKFINALPGSPVVEEMRMIFRDKELEDQNTLDSYKIEHESQIIGVVRMHGGVALKSY